jgi:prevent-host-death family protein
VLQDAKARFSELVRCAHSEGPQHVTVHGQEAAIIITPEDFRRLQGNRTGRMLIEAIQSSPCRDMELEAPRATMPVRDVVL